jgi:hypothetical protein
MRDVSATPSGIESGIHFLSVVFGVPHGFWKCNSYDIKYMALGKDILMA